MRFKVVYALDRDPAELALIVDAQTETEAKTSARKQIRQMNWNGTRVSIKYALELTRHEATATQDASER